ncbi:MAG: hypothetical protein Q9164_003157 [Protoblastenia rupestris]
MVDQGSTDADTSSCLGLGFKSWKKYEMNVILNHYGHKTSMILPKEQLMKRIRQVAEEHGLTREDRLDIINAHAAGTALPQLRPTVKQSLLTEGDNSHFRHINGRQQDNETDDIASTSDTNMEAVASYSPKLNNEIDDGRGMQEQDIMDDKASSSDNNTTIVASQSSVVDHHMVENSPNEVTSHENDYTSIANQRISKLETANNDAATTGAADDQATQPATVESKPDIDMNEDPSTCQVCYEIMNVETSPTKNLTSTCEHKLDICNVCITTSIREASRNNMWDNIKCPSCNSRLRHEDVEKAADVKTRER